jgi:hypothetical protein
MNVDDFFGERRAIIDHLVNKWRWLLEAPVSGSAVPSNLWPAMAILFENQQRTSNRGTTLMGTQTGDMVLPEKYALPIIRKVYPQLIVAKIASIQPLPLSSGGVGKIYYEDFLREDADPQTSLTSLVSDYGDTSEAQVPQRVKYNITSAEVSAIKSALAATWSSEAQEDLQGALNIDLESSLLNAMSEEILREIEHKCMRDIWGGATAGDETWSWTKGNGYATEAEWYQTLHFKFVDMEMNIYKKRWHQADWIICGTNVASFIDKLRSWHPDPNARAANTMLTTGVQFVGTYGPRWDVYLTPFLGENQAVMGCYPTSTLRTSYVYAPYIPLAPMPLVYAGMKARDDATLPGGYTNTDEWTRNIRTRYARKVVVGDMLSRLTISA